MADDYTPTMDELRVAYGQFMIQPDQPERLDEFSQKFDRALAAHDAEIRRDQAEKDAALINKVVDETGDEYFRGDEALAEDWTMHKRRTWSDGATVIQTRALAAIRAQFTPSPEEPSRG